MRNLDTALRDAVANRPATQGFPYLAETLRRAGVRTTTWWLPAMQSCYETELGPVVVQSPPPPLFDGMADIPPFDDAALMAALRDDQTGQTTFPQFAEAAWRAGGVVRWVVASMNARAHTSAREIRSTSNSMRPWIFRSGEGQREPLETAHQKAARGTGV